MDRNASMAKCTSRLRVALRKESVDRNFIDVARAADRVLSLSARRAWIEIHVRCFSPAGCWRRSPQGERG